MKRQLKTLIFIIFCTIVALSVTNAQESEPKKTDFKNCPNYIGLIFGYVHGNKFIKFESDINIIEVLEKTGGLPRNAKVRDVFLYRRQNETSHEWSVSKYKLKDLKKKKIEVPILKPCDLVVFHDEKASGVCTMMLF
ncbi:MAG: hypothetical protein R2681_04160 [Pyrinomonadaceae bacterium]